MSEKEQSYSKHPEMVRVARELSSITNSAGKVGFTVVYTGTEGNLSTHEEFQRFCFENSNNEYLLGIRMLLNNNKVYQYLASILEDLEELKGRMDKLEVSDRVESSEEQTKTKEIKTF